MPINAAQRTGCRLLANPMATNIAMHNFPFTADWNANTIEQLRTFLSVDNKYASFGTPELELTRSSKPLVKPDKPQAWEMYILDDPDQLTLRPNDVGRLESFYAYDKLPPACTGNPMPQSEWPNIMNLIFEALTFTEAAGGGAMMASRLGSGAKAALAQQMMDITSVRETRKWSNGKQASDRDYAYACSFKPYPNATRVDSMPKLAPAASTGTGSSSSSGARTFNSSSGSGSGSSGSTAPMET